jgi:hypothetical protein
MGLKTGPLAAPTGAASTQVALNPGEALDAARYAPAPRVLLRPDEFIAEEYLLACTLVQCTCGGQHMQYECFLVRRHPSGAAGATIRTKVEEMSMALPVSVATCKPRRIPFCGRCWEKHSNMVKPHMPTTEEAWAAALRTEDARRTAAAARMRASGADPASRIDIFDTGDLP